MDITIQFLIIFMIMFFCYGLRCVMLIESERKGDKDLESYQIESYTALAIVSYALFMVLFVITVFITWITL